jgi:hypothetical protein
MHAMKTSVRTLLALGSAALVLAGCGKLKAINAPAAQSGSADFSTYAALGTSISAGVQSGGLVVHHQQKSFTYLFARQVGTPFTIPSVSADGLPPLLRLVSLSPLIISNAGRVPGVPTNLLQPTPYNNMGVPFAIVADASDTTNYNNTPDRAGAFALVGRHLGPVADQALALSPTFLTIEYGSNEVLGAATRGSGTALLPPATYAFLLTALMDKIAGAVPTAKFAIVNVPDVTSVPFVTTFPAVVLDANGNPVLPLIPLIGSEGGPAAPLSPLDHVLLTAADSMAIGTGFPVGTFSYLTGAPGNDRPLLNSQVLSTTEAASIQASVDAYNVAIAGIATARGGALLDLNALLRQAATTGFTYQGQLYTSDFITGGLFSLDGVHPTDIAQGILCNTLIDAVNAEFGAKIQHVNLATVASNNSSRMLPGRIEGRALPWIHYEAGGAGWKMFPWRTGGDR